MTSSMCLQNIALPKGEVMSFNIFKEKLVHPITREFSQYAEKQVENLWEKF